MKKILIVSYFFPPCNAVSSNRAKSFAENLKEHGLMPTVVTRHWDGTESERTDFEKRNTDPAIIREQPQYTLIQLPYFAKTYLCNRFHQINVLSRFLHLIYSVFGVFSPHENAYECFYDYLRDYLKKNNFDYLMVISAPLNIVKLGHLLSEEFKIPLIVDFRDLWDNALLSDEYKPNLENKLKNFIYEFYLKRWLKKAVAVTSVSDPLIKEIQRICPNTKPLVVMNGFELKALERKYNSSEQQTSKFKFSVIGTLYPQQDLSVLIEGLQLFLNGKDLTEIELNFIGTAFFQEVGELLKNSLPKECTFVSGRVAREQAVSKTLESQVLFHAGWKGYKGIASGKVFEYLSARKNILIAPSDNDVMERIVLETNAGKVANTPEEFAQVLNQWFAEWKIKGELTYQGDIEKVKLYSRENQAKVLAHGILSFDRIDSHL